MKRGILLALYFACGLFLGGAFTYAHASTAYAYTTKKGFTNGKWNGTGTINEARTAETIESVNVGGKYIAVPMVGTVGAAALEALIIGIKASPKALVIGATINYLTSKGFNWNGDSLQVPASSKPVNNYDEGCWKDTTSTSSGACTSSPAAACISRQTTLGSIWATHFDFVPVITSATTATCNAVKKEDGSIIPTMGYAGLTGPATKCPAGYVLGADNATCLSTEYTGPSESDWDKVRNSPPPASVMKDLCERLSNLGSTSYACPVTENTTKSVTSPLSDWKTNPQTGTQSRQVAKVSPASTPENPERVEITTETETKTTTTNPTTGQTTETTESKQNENEDFCVKHPESIACSKLGDAPPEEDLSKLNKTITITRQDWGAADGSCPADLSYTLRTGQTLSFKYQPVCTGLSMFRPVIIGMGWLSAVFCFIGIARKT